MTPISLYRWMFSFKNPPYQWDVRASQWTPANSFATVLYLHTQGSYIAFWGLLTLPESYTICYPILRRVTTFWSVFWSDSDSGNERCQASAKFTPCARDGRGRLTEITWFIFNFHKENKYLHIHSSRWMKLLEIRTVCKISPKVRSTNFAYLEASPIFTQSPAKC